jgi:hypothetical protein
MRWKGKGKASGWRPMCAPLDVDKRVFNMRPSGPSKDRRLFSLQSAFLRILRVNYHCQYNAISGFIRSDHSRYQGHDTMRVINLELSRYRATTITSALEVLHNGKREICLGCRQETHGADHSFVWNSLGRRAAILSVMKEVALGMLFADRPNSI